MTATNDSRVLLDSKFFTVHAIQTTSIPPNNISLRQRILSAQTYDTKVSHALKSILKFSPHLMTKGLEDWNLKKGLILHQGHVYVSKDDNLRRYLIKQYHDHPAIGHLGQWKTYKLISQEFWWPGMSQFIRNYMDGCATCQSTKNKPRTKVPLQPNPILTAFWKSITMDFVTDLPLSLNCDSMFMVVDRFSKAIIITSCLKTIKVEQTAQLYLNNVWR